MFGSKRQGDPRVRAILDAEGLKYDIDSDGDYRLLFGLEGGRSQIVIVNSNTETFAGVEIREVWSPGLKGAGQLSAAVANDLLVRNGKYKVGAWEVSIRGDEILALFKVALSADADRSELAPVLSAVAVQADEVEQKYLQSDDL